MGKTGKITALAQASNSHSVNSQRRSLLLGAGAVPLQALLAGCGSGAGSGDVPAGAGNASASPGNAPTATTRSFVHPGLMHTEADFARIRAKIAAGAQPWLGGWNALTSSSRAGLWSVPNPLETVVRGGDGENFRTMVEDLERAYQYALRWKVSQDTAYADQAVKFLNAWSSTMKVLTGNADRFLAAGIYGYQWALAAEMMRSYPGWQAADLAAFQKLLLEVFYPLSHDFLLNHNGANITNYWANWDLCAICCILAVGVLSDRSDLYDEAIGYYKNGRGNGAAAHNVYFLHPGHLGQWQESGRDQGHSTLGMALTGLLCEMAWSQGDDLYGYANNRFLAGAEYVARSNLQDANGQYDTLPFSTYVNRQGTFTAVSTAGQPNLRPCWEVIYNHYVNRKGLSAPFVSAIAAQIRPERNDWIGDSPSFGTLSFSLDPVAAGTPPSGLTACLAGGKVLLSWWGSAYATSYSVKRAPSASGPFTAIANVSDPRTHTDVPGDGVWYYTVTATDTSGESAASNVVRVALPTELRARLPLDAGSGSTAADASGHGADATLVGGASWGDGRNGSRALLLDGQTGHLALPTGVLSDAGDFTIALWAYWNTASTNTRVFDFGSSDIAYLALIPRDSQGKLRFMITGTTYFGEQSISASTALPTGRWVHLAVTLAGTRGTLYVDGAAAGSNDTMPFAPFQLGSTTQNWLGRSQYPADPFFDGRMQDLRLYSGALSADQVAALAAS